LEISFGAVLPGELYKDSSSSYSLYDVPPDYIEFYREDGFVSTLDLGATTASRSLVPISPVFSLGLEMATSNLSWHESERSFDYANSNWGTPYTSSVASSSDWQGNAALLWLGMPMRFHTSGRDWNLPWGRGGSPWGKVFHPIFEINHRNGLGYEFSSQSLKLEFMDMDRSMTLPLASWLAVELGTLWQEGGAGWGNAGRQVVPLLQSGSVYIHFGIKAGLPLSSWFGEADYGANANPDGRLGLPLFSFDYRQDQSASSFPGFRFTDLGLTWPFKPWLSLAFHWERQSAGDVQGPWRPVDSFLLSPRFYWSALASKSIEAAAQKPENQSPEAATPAPNAIQEKP